MNRLSIYDIFVVFLGIIALLVVGLFKKSSNKEDDFYLASRKSNIFFTVLSFVATEISAMTIVGVPAISFKGNWNYLEFFIGSAISRILIAYIFIPTFYKYNCITIYEFIGKRFSQSVRITTTIFFFITRLLSSGIRLYAASLAISSMLKTDLFFTILTFIFISYFFIGKQGMKAVIASGVYQATMFYICAWLIIISVIKLSNTHPITIIQILSMEGKFKILNLNIEQSQFDVFFLAFLNGVFGSLASFGTDYEMMQRLLTLKTRKDSQKTILWTILFSLLLVILYLLCGSFIYFFLKNNAIPFYGKSDEIMSFFSANFLKDGLKGFFILTVFLATVDLPLLSLGTSFVNDIYKNISKSKEINYIKLTKISMFIFAFFLFIIAYMCKHSDTILWFGFEVHGVNAGSMLGVFLLGILTKKNLKPIYIIVSMIISSLSCFSFMITNRYGITNIPWSSFVIIGTFIVFFLPQILSIKFFRKKT